MFDDLPDLLKVKVRKYLEAGMFTDAKELHDSWVCSKEEHITSLSNVSKDTAILHSAYNQ